MPTLRIRSDRYLLIYLPTYSTIHDPYKYKYKSKYESSKVASNKYIQEIEPGVASHLQHYKVTS